jgi:predicted Zn finger-like uncharacterized protein
MLIVCPSCATSYQVEPSSLGAAGRSVRCVRCRKVWFASNSDALADIARAHREDVNIYTAANSVAGLAEPDATEAVATAEPLPPELPAPASDPAELPPPEAAAWDDRGPVPRPEPQDEPAPPAPPATEDAPAPLDATASPPIVPAMPQDVESAASRRFSRPPRRRKSRVPMPGLSTVILLLIAINAGLIGFRAEIARYLPQTASLYAAIGLPVNLRGLVFADVVTRIDAQDGVQMLRVEGIIKSHSRRAAEVPRIRFSIRNAAGQEIYSWTALPSRNALAAGAAMPFQARLASPPPESHEVLVRFFNRRDLIAGIQ